MGGEPKKHLGKDGWPKDELFRVNDFKPVTVKIDFHNHTTGTEIVDGKARVGKKTSRLSVATPISLQEITEKGFILEAPEKTCAQGHHLSLCLRVQGPKIDFTFHTSAKVKTVENCGPDANRIEVELFQFEENDWKKFQDFFTQTQEEINSLFAAVRGY